MAWEQGQPYQGRGRRVPCVCVWVDVVRPPWRPVRLSKDCIHDIHAGTHASHLRGHAITPPPGHPRDSVFATIDAQKTTSTPFCKRLIPSPFQAYDYVSELHGIPHTFAHGPPCHLPKSPLQQRQQYVMMQ